MYVEYERLFSSQSTQCNDVQSNLPGYMSIPQSDPEATMSTKTEKQSRKRSVRDEKVLQIYRINGTDSTVGGTKNTWYYTLCQRKSISTLERHRRKFVDVHHILTLSPRTPVVGLREFVLSHLPTAHINERQHVITYDGIFTDSDMVKLFQANYPYRSFSVVKY